VWCGEMPDDATALAHYCRRVGWLLRFLPPLAVAGVVMLVPAIAHASCRPLARASSGTPISGVVPTVKCFERTLDQDFRRHYARFQSDEAEATLESQLGISNIENPVKAPPHGDTCNSDDYNRSYSHRKARIVLDSLVPTAREFLDKARDDLQDMSEAQPSPRRTMRCCRRLPTSGWPCTARSFSVHGQRPDPDGSQAA
jgi:hypothetical protein